MSSAADIKHWKVDKKKTSQMQQFQMKYRITAEISAPLTVNILTRSSFSCNKKKRCREESATEKTNLWIDKVLVYYLKSETVSPNRCFSWKISSHQNKYKSMWNKLKYPQLTLFLYLSWSSVARLRLCWCCSSSFWEGGGAVGRPWGLLRFAGPASSPTPIPSLYESLDCGKEVEPSDSSLSSSLEDWCGSVIIN